MAKKKINKKNPTAKKVVGKKRVSKKRKPTGKIRVPKGAEPKKLSCITSGLMVAMAGVVCGLVVWNMIKKKGLLENIATREKVFNIITENCSSMGVNKMEIVQKICDEIFAERKKRKDAEFEITELEAKITTITERLEQVTKFAKGEKNETQENKYGNTQGDKG